jgi:hypothetical protein
MSRRSRLADMSSPINPNAHLPDKLPWACGVFRGLAVSDPASDYHAIAGRELPERIRGWKTVHLGGRNGLDVCMIKGRMAPEGIRDLAKGERIRIARVLKVGAGYRVPEKYAGFYGNTRGELHAFQIIAGGVDHPLKEGLTASFRGIVLDHL